MWQSISALLAFPFLFAVFQITKSNEVLSTVCPIRPTLLHVYLHSCRVSKATSGEEKKNGKSFKAFWGLGSRSRSPAPLSVWGNHSALPSSGIFGFHRCPRKLCESPSWQIVAPPFQPNPRDGTKTMAQKQMENLCSSSTPFENHFSTSAICNTWKLITFCTYWLIVQMHSNQPSHDLLAGRAVRIIYKCERIIIIIKGAALHQTDI